jgi:hypothetical protein
VPRRVEGHGFKLHMPDSDSESESAALHAAGASFRVPAHAGTRELQVTVAVERRH